MAALARSEINTVTKRQQNSNHSSVITEISVTARIDYILRFSKQVVLVVAEHTEKYSTVAQQFLVNLSSGVSNEFVGQVSPVNKQCNVAFVSASIKLNDIQMRCRLIEQLFGNSLFDPEQSLAVSILRLAKQQSEAITIIVEHAHALSLQVKYELSQLVAIAKKNKQEINVVMFAQPKAAEEIGHNKSIFKNKLTIVDAVSGQLYSAEKNKLTNKESEEWLLPWQKIVLLIGLCTMISVSVGLYFYLQTEDGREYLQQPVLTNKKDAGKINQFIVNEAKLVKFEISTVESQKMLSTEIVSKVVVPANAYDINQALIKPKLITEAINTSAEANDVLSALLVSEEPPLEVSQPKEINLAVNKAVLINALDTDYYLTKSEDPQAMVVQIAGFSDSKHWQDFLALYPQQEFYSYQKVLSDSVFTVVTSKVYPDRFTAKASIQNFPEPITKRQLWLKPISTVITEINTFKE